MPFSGMKGQVSVIDSKGATISMITLNDIGSTSNCSSYQLDSTEYISNMYTEYDANVIRYINITTSKGAILTKGS